MAKLLQDRVHGDLYEISTSRHYSDNDWIAMDEANAEIKNHDLPPIVSPKIGLSPYDVILIGGPVWGQTLSAPLMSFLNENSFAEKKISAFWTFYDHDEFYDKTMKSMEKGGEYLFGLPMPRSLAGNPLKLNEVINEWVRRIEQE